MWPRKDRTNGCFADSEIGKPAVTHYKVLERFGYVTLISAMETGRTHQIRVHLKHIGHTLFNDERYGGDFERNYVYQIQTVYRQFLKYCQDRPCTPRRLDLFILQRVR
jgi:23S rRNA pseudouridine1911/1915/1917 synthase